jgi:hypothetical protein
MACCFFEDVDKCALDAPVFWRPEAYPAVLPVQVCDARESLDRLVLPLSGCDSVLLIEANSREHLLLRQGYRAIQLACTGQLLRGGNIALIYQLEGFCDLRAKLTTLSRLESLHRLGAFPSVLFPPEPRARRLTQVLQALHGWLAGASQREIAMALFGRDRVTDEWSHPGAYLADQTRRAIKRGRALMQGGYRQLLLA